MPPQKFSSVRYPKRRTSSLIPFRDDSSLVAFRYEHTVQAEPPILIPAPRSLRRSASASIRTASSSSPTTPYLGPHTPPIPPSEEHPALRGDTSSTESRGDDWKRDSGVAPTASPATTIYEEDLDKLSVSDGGLNIQADPSTVTVSPAAAAVEQTVTQTPSRTTRRVMSASGLATTPPPPSSRDILPLPSSPESGPESSTGVASSPSRITKSFSLRAVNRLKKKSLTEMSTRTASTSGSPSTHRPRTPFTEEGDINQSAGRGAGFGNSLAGELGRSPPDGDVTNYKGATKLPHKVPSLPQRPATNHGGRPSTRDFAPLSVPIPTDSFIGDDFLTAVSFSKRGSIMFGGKRAVSRETMTETSSQKSANVETESDKPRPATSPQPNANPKAEHDIKLPSIDAALDGSADKATESPAPAVPRIRVLPANIERESQKVRSFYEVGDAFNWEQGAPIPPSLPGERLAPTPEAPVEKEEHDTSAAVTTPRGTPDRPTIRSATSSLLQPDSVRREYELAGGVEDWEDVDGADVDRYGFIRPRRQGTPMTTESKPGGSTSRRRNVLLKRDVSDLNSARVPNRKVSAKSLHTQASELSVASRRSALSALRQATNMLPQNRDRRIADEAGEMLTHTPGLQHIAEDESANKISEALKQKESERTEKWRKMAKVVKKGKDGEGMEFEFDTKNQKLIDRTWKGIPDRWRGSAWYSFLATSARARKDAPTEEHLISEFHRLQGVSCEDDVQIDLDVPRTINQHIMFRRRYRGGQRLLFRVLHAVALYFDEIGYVQGMASLAATLLCYFAEEKAFVMMVWMWQLRGLEQLYRTGFDGLMACLKDFEMRWMKGKDVGKKLDELGIDATAFGTRWYLTLFNLAIPFPAQLRVWDVFLLLGDAPPKPTKPSSGKAEGVAGAPTELEVLHAASAALIDALSDIILGSDFENAMKVLTSWIPVKDEDLLMKVARAELKYRKRKRA